MVLWSTAAGKNEDNRRHETFGDVEDKGVAFRTEWFIVLHVWWVAVWVFVEFV